MPSSSPATAGIHLGGLFVPYKYMALILLMVQTTSSILVLRLSRTSSSHKYLSTTAVVMAELFKVIGSMFLLSYERKENLIKTLSYTTTEMMTDLSGTLKLSVPALLYTVQNNLLFIALSHLPAATYQVTYQLKILTTAIFSVIMLSRLLSIQQWVSLVALMIGVALVQWPTDSSSAVAADKSAGDQLFGLIAVLVACVLSGFAGVYFELILKTTKSSLWYRNIQLGLFGFFLGLIGVVLNDWTAVQENGFFQYYDSITWTAISLQAFGGLVIAAVIKYADNILKGFANSISIILTGLISWAFMNDIAMSWFFVLGSLMVVVATFMYGLPDSNAQPVIPVLPKTMAGGGGGGGDGSKK